MKIMKNKFIVVYSVIASLFILFSVSFFAMSLYREFSLGESRTNTNFIRMVSRIKTASYQNDMYSDNFTAKLVQAIGNFDDIAFIDIKIDGGSVLVFPDSKIRPSPSNLTMQYTERTTIRDASLEIDTVMYLLRPTSIHRYARISFLMILIVTIITLILIFYIQMKDSGDFQSAAEVYDDSYPAGDEIAAENPAEESAADDEPEAAHSVPADSTDAEENPQESDDGGTIRWTQADEQQEAASFDDATSVPDSPAKTEPIVLQSDEEKPAAIESEPNGLFSPVTGLGWESYLMTRLENEVNRAAASEMDIALFVIQIPGSKRESETIKKTCGYLAVQFQFKDLLFEYKDDCIVAMKINMSLDEGLNFADKLHADITDIIEADGLQCFIGLSTRSIRIVAADRLLTEAEQALEHAKENHENVIAFRADSEKYRQYLEENR